MARIYILLTAFKILNKMDPLGYSSNLLMNTRRNKQAEQIPGQNSTVWFTFLWILLDFWLRWFQAWTFVKVNIYKLAYEVGCPVFGQCRCKSPYWVLLSVWRDSTFHLEMVHVVMFKLYFPFRLTFSASIEWPCFRPTDLDSGQFSLLAARRELICP